MGRNTLSAVSLFSGAGGMDVGFSSAGFDILIANDIDRDACETYELNHASEILYGDLNNNIQQLQKFRGVDMLFGGPPCQGFSVAGKMDPNDERSKLLMTFFDVVSLIRPVAFVCENVKALGQLQKWHNVRREISERVSREYNFAMITLSANDFGVPQKRERLFCIGVSKDLGSISSDAFSSILTSQLAGEKTQAQSVREVIQKLGRAGSEENSEICNAKITFARSPVLRRSPYAGMIFNGAGRPLHSDGFASTLPASMGGNKTPIVDEGEIFDDLSSYVEEYHATLLAGKAPRTGHAPDRLRRLTIAECLGFQTFPKGYELAGRQSSKYRQIGNAVPCKLAEVVANVVRDLVAQKDLLAYVKHLNALKVAA